MSHGTTRPARYVDAPSVSVGRPHTCTTTMHAPRFSCIHEVLLLCVMPLFACCWEARAQFTLAGAQSAALAGASTGLSTDLRGGANPAAWAHVDRWTLMLDAAQLYGLSELRYGDVLIIGRMGSTAIAAGASTFGYDLYRSIDLDFGGARRVGVGTFRRVAIGLRARRHSVRIERYGSASALGITAGMILPLTPLVSLGVSVDNALASGPLRHDLARRLTIGVALRSSTAFTFVSDVGKELEAPVAASAGVELTPHTVLHLRGGVRSSPFMLAAGFGVVLPHVRADAAAVRHPVLGWSTVLSLHIAH